MQLICAPNECNCRLFSMGQRCVKRSKNNKICGNHGAKSHRRASQQIAPSKIRREAHFAPVLLQFFGFMPDAGSKPSAWMNDVFRVFPGKTVMAKTRGTVKFFALAARRPYNPAIMKARQGIPAIVAGILAVLACAPVFGETPRLSGEVLNAKSIAVRVNLVEPFPGEPEGYRDSIRSRAENKIKDKKRFAIVDEPSRADLVCIVFIYRARWRENKPPYFWAHTVLVMKGGASPHWDAAPLWIDSMFNGPSAPYLYLLGKFHKSFEKAVKADHRREANPPDTPEAVALPQRQMGKSIFVTCEALREDKCAGGQEGYQIQRIVKSNPGIRWNVVDDPAKADLVVVWFDVGHLGLGMAGGVGLTIKTSFGALFLFKGGTRPDWSETPWRVVLGRSAPDLFQRLTSAL
ncbi:MAG: hypothetical protein ACHP79_02250 [Terriglobales bacterium]